MLVIGFGRFGQIVSQVLLARQIDATVIDANAERVRQAFAATPIDLDNGHHVEATLSIGLGCAAAAPASIEPLLQVADEALSLAKGGGRNRIVRRDLAAPRVASPVGGMAVRSR